VKVGFAISAVFIVALTIVVPILASPSADPPTRATSPDRLEAMTLGDDFPRLYEITNVSDSALAHYEAAGGYYAQNRSAFQNRKPAQEHIDVLAGHFIKAMHAGQMRDGFLDSQTRIGVMVGQIDNMMPYAAGALSSYLRDQFEDETLTEEDVQIAMALFAFGERCFRHNTLLQHRMAGLEYMNDGLGYVNNWDLEKNGRTSDKSNLASDRYIPIIEAWPHKLKIVMDTDPYVGDLLNIAKNDQDMTWRIAATQRLGIAKFTDGNKGNRRAIASYLAQARQADNRLLAEAARAADELTREEFRRLR